MGIKVTESAFEVTAEMLTAASIGARFAYKAPDDSSILYGQIAALEDRGGKVRITVAGVVTEGSSVVLVLSPTESLFVEPSE